MKAVYPTQIYPFLQHLDRNGEIHAGENRILDCGAGGKVPALGLFYEHGFTTAGIDISAEQVALAETFEREHAMHLHIQKGDMRTIPFPEASFDFVFEIYSMVHLPKADIKNTLAEMKRVLKPGGLCYVGFMLDECFPRHGKEGNPGEFHEKEYGQQVVHSIFNRQEAHEYVSDWEILQSIHERRSSPAEVSSMSLEDYECYYVENEVAALSKSEWLQTYPERAARWQYAHLFFILRKL